MRHQNAYPRKARKSRRKTRDVRPFEGTGDLPSGRSRTTFRRKPASDLRSHPGGIQMKVSRELSLAGVLVLAAGFAPAGAVHGQSRDGADMLIRAAQVGRGSHIGVTVQDIEESDKKDVKSGIVVETVDSGGPAEKAGIKPGDAIVEFDGDRVRSVRQFQRLVQESAPGRAVGAVLSRGGQRVTVNITPDQLGN